MKQATSFEDVYEQIALRNIPFVVAFFFTMCLSYGFLFVIDFIPEPIPESKRAETSVSSDNVIIKTTNKINGGLIPKRPVEETPTPSLRVIIPEQSTDTEVYEPVSGNNQAADSAAITSEGDTLPTTEWVSTENVTEPASVVIPFPVVASAEALPVSIMFPSLENKKVVVKNPTSRTIADLDAALLGGVVRHPDSADFENTGNIFILGHSSYLPNVFNKNFQAFNGIQHLTWGDKVHVQSGDTEYIYRVEKVFQAKASDVTVPNSRGVAKLTLATCNSFGSKDDRFVVEASLFETKTL